MKRIRLLQITVLTLLGLVNAQWAAAQDVTISPTTGSMMAALTQEGEVGSQDGWSSTWRHNQLPLTLTVADFCNITKGGEIANPAGNMIVHNNQIVIDGGQTTDVYIGISLPKGFRFTGYEIVLLNNLQGVTISGASHGRSTKIFYETDDLSWNSSTTDMDYNKAIDYNKYSTIRDAVYNKDEHILAVAKKASGEFRMDQYNEGSTEYTISRTSVNESDMSNHLYFRISHTDRVYFGVTIKSAVFYFSAEGDFTETVQPEMAPSSITSVGVNYMKSSFTTSKLDLGMVSLDKYGHYTYDYMNVKDMLGYNIIMQKDAPVNGVLPETAGGGTIYSTYNGGKYYYGLGNNTYYVECPVTVPNEGGTESPIGFRIVGAKVNYAYGEENEAGTQPATKKYEQFNLYRDVQGNWGTYRYYIGNGYERYESPTAWFIDEDGYVRCGDSGQYYLTVATVRWRPNRWSDYQNVTYLTTTQNKSDALKFRKSNGYLQVKDGNYQGNYVCYGAQADNTYYWRLRDKYNQTPAIIRSTNTFAEISIGNVNVPAFTPKPYTLTVYGKTGKETDIVRSVSVSESNKSGSVDLGELNNDAIKFKISGLEGTGAKALITVELTMQALDPYIKSLDIVCQEADASGNTLSTGRTLTQTFTASNFAVRGGRFYFYVPEDFTNQCKFTFENLMSDYGDNTYWGNTSSKNKARYSLVKSPYWTDNSNLYSTSYDPDADYETKVYATVAGTSEFVFNNADQVSSGNAQYLEEYPFSLSNYSGDFENVVVGVNGEKTAYLFTCDETRYNISPVTSTQHRYYAYYQMDMVLQKNTYTGVIEWQKVYDSSWYNDGTTTREDAQYGALIKTTKASAAENEYGYLTVGQIQKLIVDNLGKNGGPAKKDQILYVDASKLLSVQEDEITNAQTGVVTKTTLDKLKEGLGDNVLVFLPNGTTANHDNFASLNESGSTFQAAKDIVITDQRPFYSPYDIQVGTNGYARYTRTTTVTNKKVSKASVILPFTIDLNDGAHTNADGSSFMLYQMQPENCLSFKKDEAREGKNYAAHFTLVSGRASLANEPYFVEVTSAPSGEGMENVSFAVICKGASIVKTSQGAQGVFTSASTASGTADGKSVDFTAKGSYGGQKIAKSGNYIFYYANDKFYNNQNLTGAGDLFVSPFRSYYTYDGTNLAKMMNMFDVSFFENESSETTEISDVKVETDLKAVGGYGSITLTASKDSNITIASLNGMSVERTTMKAGDVRTIQVPAGLYVVNGVKIMVK